MKHHCKPTYTGHWPHHGQDCHPPAHQPHGFCHSCCQPASMCCCHQSECRKESRELLVMPSSKSTVLTHSSSNRSLAQMVAMSTMDAPTDNQPIDDTATALEDHFSRLSKGLMTNLNAGRIEVDHAFIGGGCCVHLSVEYMPIDRKNAPSVVGVLVKDSENTSLMWGKKNEDPTSGYQIQEDIITTNPGAELTLYVSNVIARVRWCEVFSC